jgi:predicted HicB family RNase H-like nuclease
MSLHLLTKEKIYFKNVNTYRDQKAMKKERKKLFSIRIEKKLLDKIQEKAQSEEMGMSEFIRRAVWFEVNKDLLTK